MIKMKLMTGIVLAAFTFAPTMVLAGETSPSYANKKSGKVVFKSDEEKTTDVISASDEAGEVTSIEPAAGAEISEDGASVSDAKESSLADDMKLPRK